MDARIPAPVQPVLREYLLLVEKELPGLIVGFYPHGSLALGAFNLHSSDIDFIAVVSRPCQPSDVVRLRLIHRAVAKNHPRWPLSGSYLQWGDLGQARDSIVPAPFYHDGVLVPSGHHDISSVTWCLLKNRGIGLLGHEPQNLAYTVDWEILLSEMQQNLNSYWKNFVRQPKRMAWLLMDFGIEWTVLGVLRQYFTFREHDITSKTGAGEYALGHLPESWHGIIREALRIRERTGKSPYRLKIVRAMEAHAFLRYIIDVCNAEEEQRKANVRDAAS